MRLPGPTDERLALRALSSSETTTTLCLPSRGDRRLTQWRRRAASPVPRAHKAEGRITYMTPPLYEDTTPGEVEGAGILQLHFARLDQANSRCEAFAVLPGSLLDRDDTATAYDPISYQVRFLFGALFDHIGTLRRTLDDHGLPMVAAYPLIRAGLESGAQILWLTTGGQRSKRVFRALHRVWDMASMSDEALQHLIPGRESYLPGLRVRLDQLLAEARAGQRSLDRTYPSMTNIVVDAGRFVRSRTFTPIDVWRLCSSMAHANRSVALSILEAREDGPRTPIGGTYLMTSSYRTIAAFVGVVVEVVDAALDARDRLNELP